MMLGDPRIARALFLVPIFLIVLVGPRVAFAQVDNSTDAYKGVEYCVQCHPAEAEMWATSKHAEAYSDPKFSEEWKSLGSPPSCLECHTSVFNVTSAKYLFEGVTCEQCHGPGLTMNVNASSLFCAKCHSGPYPTYAEWTRSGPGHINATCILCHQQHTLTVFGGNSTTVCGRCHESHVDLVASSPHGAGTVKLECATCHMYIKPANFTTGAPAQTGHSFSMNATQLPCQTCHDFTLEKHSVLGFDSGACLTCHGEIHGLNLKLVNGTILSRNDTVPLCGECHLQRLVWWQEGIHGAQTNPYAPCTQCHLPHNPVVNGIATLSSYQPRQEGSSPSILVFIALAVVVEALFFIAIFWRK